METQLKKWGNSLALRIPSSILKTLKLEEGSLVQLTLKQESLVIKPLKKKTKYTLEQLLAGVTKENRHEETSTGQTQGEEHW